MMIYASAVLNPLSYLEYNQKVQKLSAAEQERRDAYSAK